MAPSSRGNSRGKFVGGVDFELEFEYIILIKVIKYNPSKKKKKKLSNTKKSYSVEKNNKTEKKNVVISSFDMSKIIKYSYMDEIL